MKKVIRYILKTLAWITGILVFLWIALWVAVELNEARLISKISEAIQKKTHGKVSIGGASVSLIKTFPVLSLQLSNVLIRDSLYPIHKKDFLTAADIYLRISLRELLRGRSALGRISINNGSLNIITDSLGRSNEYILNQEKQPEGEPKSSVPVFILNNVAFNYENPVRRKRYQGLIKNFQGEIKPSEKFVTMSVTSNILVKSLSFDTNKGSYIKDMNVEGAFALVYNKQLHDLLVNHVGLRIDGQPFLFDGYFRVDTVRSDFSLAISTSDIEYEKATSMLNDTLQTRARRYSFNKRVSLKVTIMGQTAKNNAPDVRIQMNVDLPSVTSIANFTSLQFGKGTSVVDISIISSEKAKDTVNGDLNGSIQVSGADIRYLPRDFTLKECNGTILFNSNDIIIDSLAGIAGRSALLMNGRTRNLITLGSTDPGTLNMRWKIFSPDLHMNDFKAFLYKGEASSKQSSLDKMFESGDVYIQLAAARMDYNHFLATHVKGQVVLQDGGIQLQNVYFNHANGSMELNGEILNGFKSNTVTLHTKMKKMDVPLLFAAFDNFGQDAITKNNLRGSLTANVDFRSAITNQLKLISADTKGSVEFLLENGELNNFEPLIEVSKKAFKKQDFSEIKFADLKNKLDILGTTFIVNPMEIRSTAITFFVEGVYDFKKGTDMSIQFPLRNLTKNQSNTDLSDEVKAKKGISLRLRAKTGDDGKLKVSWDPFRKSIKNRDGIKNSLEKKNDKQST
jgi:hypothetical protein